MGRFHTLVMWTSSLFWCEPVGRCRETPDLILQRSSAAYLNKPCKSLPHLLKLGSAITKTALFSENQVANLVKTSVPVPYALHRMSAWVQRAKCSHRYRESGCQNHLIYLIHSSWGEKIPNSKCSTLAVMLKHFCHHVFWKKCLKLYKFRQKTWGGGLGQWSGIELVTALKFK